MASLPPLLADVNIGLPVIAFLRAEGVDVASVYERGLAWLHDASILRMATDELRFVLTHDADFGALVLAAGQSFHGILFLRPGDDPPDRVIEGLRPLLSFACDWSPPLIAVYRAGRLRLRRQPG